MVNHQWSMVDGLLIFSLMGGEFCLGEGMVRVW